MNDRFFRPRRSVVHPAPAADRHEHLRYEDAPAPRLAEEIQSLSPEGPPADPTMGPRRIGIVVGAAAGIVTAIGVVVAILIEPPALGISFVGLGLLLLLANPEIWASFFRAREREQALHELEEGVDPVEAAIRQKRPSN